MIIAIDGHSSCGKSTLAKDLAKHLGIVYIDSGAMYRAVAFYLLKNNIPITEHNAILQALPSIVITITYFDGENQIMLNNEIVTEQIRSMEVNHIVSEVAAISEIRKKMVELQRSLASKTSVIMDGRDIGSVVFPHADIKFFITASLNIRAQRRYHELRSKGIEVNLEEITKNLIHRDHIDSSRHDSPLIHTEDAIVIDNSELTRKEQLHIALQWIQNLTST